MGSGKILTYSDLGGGVNNGLIAAHKIADNEARSMSNLASYDSPILETIYPSTALGTSFSTSVRLLTVHDGNTLCAVANQNFYTWGGAAWSTSLRSGLTGTIFSACNFMDKLVFGSAADGILFYNGVSVSTSLDNTPEAPYLTQSANRVFAAGHDDVGVKFCALRDLDDWSSAGDAGSGTIEVEAPSGEPNTGIGALTTGRVVIFKYTSFHELYGTGPINFQIADRLYGMGCIAHKTIVNVGNWLYWLGVDGIYRWNGGLPQRISDRIKNYLPDVTINSVVFHHAAGTDGRYYYISLGNEIVMAFDTFTETWWGPWNYGELAYYFANYLATGSKGFYMATFAGKVLRLDNPDATGTASWEWVSKSYYGNNFAKKESISDLWISAEVFTGSTLNVYFSARFKDVGDGNDWTLVKTIGPNSIGTVRVTLPRISTQDFHRIKLSGSGKVNIYGIDKDMREV